MSRLHTLLATRKTWMLKGIKGVLEVHGDTGRLPSQTVLILPIAVQQTSDSTG